MTQESKSDLNSSSNEQTIGSGFKWDLSVSPQQAQYSNYNQTATAISQCNVRGPFWSSGRHLINIKVIKGGDGSSQVGIGAVDKLFDISPGHYVGEDSHSYGTWDNTCPCHNKGPLKVVHDKLLREGDIVTVDLDLNKNTISWAINGQYLSDKDIATNIPNPAAIAVTLWIPGVCVQVIEYKTTHRNPLH
eukprot:193278_1